tara:strand:+ start:1049 stop:1669 length:621 start_codon:yes stop_codon:yes gene_type:complete
MKENSILLSTAYLPPISYFYYINNYENIFIETQEHYQKQSIRNHTIILGSQGYQKIIIPVKRKSYSKKIITELEISSELWKKKHIQAIQTNYGNSPFFIHYFNDICEIILRKRKFLFDLNQDLLSFFLNELDIKKEIRKTTNYQSSLSDNFIDFRNFEYKQTINLKYNQTFIEKGEINNNISIIDLLFNLGNDSKNFISKLNFEKT